MPFLSRLPLCLLCALLAVPLPAAPASAAFRSSSDVVTPEQTWNPKPAADDVSLPMPCGQVMVMRAVGVPAGRLLQDRCFTMGVSDAANQDRQLYEGSFKGYIAAPFTLKDLPAGWRGQLTSAGDGYTFYFMGKYEVSQGQWEAVMNALDDDGTEKPEACPRTPGKGANLPRGGLSWFDAQAFLQKYNAWLVKNRLDALPRFEGTKNIGFVRLPTEEEWEFAARGGAKVPREELDNNDIFPLEGRELKDYGVFTVAGALSGPQPIGSRHPNPLGLHDTVGNVREIVDGFFRMSVADVGESGGVYHRLHGAAGGVLCKGGSYSSAEDAVRPGWRDEVPLFTAAGPSRPADLGMRVALSGLNIPNAQRLQALKKENSQQGAQRPAASGGTAPQRHEAALQLQGSGSPLEALDKISAVAATPEMQSNLAQLRVLLQDQQGAYERQRATSLENTARSLLYQEETIRAFAYRYVSTTKTIEKIAGLQGAPRADVEKMLAQARQDLDGYMRTLMVAANYYRSCLKLVSGAPEAGLERLLAQFRQEYAGHDVFNAHMRTNIDTLEKHVRLMRTKGADALNARQVVRDVVPQRHLKVLPL